jgi:hypothetical protein
LITEQARFHVNFFIFHKGFAYVTAKENLQAAERSQSAADERKNQPLRKKTDGAGEGPLPDTWQRFVSPACHELKHPSMLKGTATYAD